MNEIKCPNCGYDNVRNAKRCGMCEKRIARQRSTRKENKNVTTVISIVFILVLVVGNFYIFMTTSTLWGLFTPFASIIVVGIIKGWLDSHKKGDHHQGKTTSERNWGQGHWWGPLNNAQRKVLREAKRDKQLTILAFVIATVIGVVVIIWVVSTALGILT